MTDTFKKNYKGKFKIGDILRLRGNFPSTGAKKGALARCKGHEIHVWDSNKVTLVTVTWLDELAGNQSDGGYWEDFFVFNVITNWRGEFE